MLSRPKMAENLTVYLAVAGGTASGKTTFATRLKDHLKHPDVMVIGLDSYYKDLSHLTPQEKACFNFDHPEAFDVNLLKFHLSELRQGRSIEVPKYDYTTHSRVSSANVICKPAPILIFEGILILYWKEVRELFSHSIFIEASPELRLSRRISRDVRERGRSEDSVNEQWRTSVQPMHMEFCEPTKEFATEILSGEKFELEVFDRVAGFLQSQLR